MTARRWILLAEDNANDADLTIRALSANQSPSGGAGLSVSARGVSIAR